MEANKALNHIVNTIDSKVVQLQEALSDGRVETLEEYKKVCGEIRGLLTARNYITDLNKSMESSDE
jgi:uncharacterized protein YaaR (DUF327 family)